MLQPSGTKKTSSYGSFAGGLIQQQPENVREEALCEKQGMEPAAGILSHPSQKNRKVILLLTLVGLLTIFLNTSSSDGKVGYVVSRVLLQLGSAIQFKSVVQLGELSAVLQSENFNGVQQISPYPSCVDSVDGFQTRNIYSTDNQQGQLRWYCAPDSWDPVEGRREGRGGSWAVDDSARSMTITPPAKKDYWRRTYYEPLLIKDDGPFLYATLSADKYYTVETTLKLTSVRQFDQAGILIRLGPEHWLKTGIEVVDHQPRLSCVVTNSYSDWSTQSWSNYTTVADEDKIIVHVYAQIRVHCRGTNFVVEAKMPHPSWRKLGGGTPEWQFIRIAHMVSSRSPVPSSMLEDDATLQDAAPHDGTFWAGVFAASPEDQQGGHVTFTQFTITEGSHFEHNADGNQDT